MAGDALYLELERGNVLERRFVEGVVPEIAEGEALLRLEAFALTANTVTYAVFGEQLRYWDFFPAAEAGYGRCPCWGHGDVLASKAEGVPVGARVYGYFPIGTHLVVKPTRVRGGAFTDGATHRAALPGVYNNYTPAAGDADEEAMVMLFRPLFTTSWLIADFLQAEKFFGAKRVLISSASSKTAVGLGWALKQSGAAEAIGLTSAGNKAFVEKLGMYDRVVAYGELATVNAGEPIVYVDFGGSAAVRGAVHRQFGDALAYDCAVGAADWSSAGPPDASLPGPAPAFFFAPTQVETRTKEWGAAVLNRRIGEASAAFLAAARPSIRIVRESGRAAVDSYWEKAVKGAIAAADGVILKL